jgi:hypothetical protein
VTETLRRPIRLRAMTVDCLSGRPERAYDITFFDEFARAAGWTERLSLKNPEFRPRS